MNLLRLFTALLALTSTNLFGQELLTDSSFLAGFGAKTISLKELKIKRNPTWTLMAGTGTREQVVYTEEQEKAFRLYADSIEGIRADLYTYDKEICDSRCRIAKFECLKRSLQGKGEGSTCDSVREICMEGCAEIKQIRDNMLDDSLENIWNLHEFKYRYDILHTFSPKKKSIPIRSHADTLTLFRALGFAPQCSPEGFSWFIITKYRKKIIPVDTQEKLLSLLGPIDSYAKAYLILCAEGYTTPHTFPQDTVCLSARQKGDSYFFILRLRQPECPEDEITLLFRVDPSGKTEMMDLRLNFRG